MSREVAVTTPPHDRRDLGMAKEKCLGWCRCCAPKGSEEESQVGLVVPEDVLPSEAETMILPRTPDESLVVDVAREP